MYIPTLIYMCKNMSQIKNIYLCSHGHNILVVTSMRIPQKVYMTVSKIWCLNGCAGNE